MSVNNIYYLTRPLFEGADSNLLCTNCPCAADFDHLHVRQDFTIQKITGKLIFHDGNFRYFTWSILHTRFEST
jgi:hypothetical protein